MAAYRRLTREQCAYARPRPLAFRVASSQCPATLSSVVVLESPRSRIGFRLSLSRAA